ncbi:MAG: hypothetical protein J5I81_12675 [Nitrococcus mobilis]|nr:hypothetical protein [Nitrococcus mobilis]
MRRIVIRDLHQDKTLDRKARAVIVGGARGVIGTLDGGPNRVVITEWQLFTLAMEGKVTYK